MARTKLQRFAALASFPRVVEKDAAETVRGSWSRDIFHNTHPIVLELACGKGEYSLAIGRLFPELNVIGIDRKGERIWRGATHADSEGLENVGFLRGDIGRLPDDFAPGEVQEIWVLFPDPYPKDRHAERRLTSAGFLDIYAHILPTNGVVHFKTDDAALYEYSLESFAAAGWDIEEACDTIDTRSTHGPHARSGTGITTPKLPELLATRTAFEQRHRALGKQIRYIRARRPHAS